MDEIQTVTVGDIDVATRRYRYAGQVDGLFVVFLVLRRNGGGRDGQNLAAIQPDLDDLLRQPADAIDIGGAIGGARDDEAMQVGRGAGHIAQILAVRTIDLDAGMTAALHAHIYLAGRRYRDIAMGIAYGGHAGGRRQHRRSHSETLRPARARHRQRAGKHGTDKHCSFHYPRLLNSQPENQPGSGYQHQQCYQRMDQFYGPSFRHMRTLLLSRQHWEYQIVALNEQIEAYCHHMQPDQCQDYIEDHPMQAGDPGRGLFADQQRQGAVKTQPVIGKQSGQSLQQQHGDEPDHHQATSRIVAGKQGLVGARKAAQIRQYLAGRIQEVAKARGGRADHAPDQTENEQGKQR